MQFIQGISTQDALKRKCAVNQDFRGISSNSYVIIVAKVRRGEMSPLRFNANQKRQKSYYVTLKKTRSKFMQRAEHDIYILYTLVFNNRLLMGWCPGKR